MIPLIVIWSVYAFIVCVTGLMWLSMIVESKTAIHEGAASCMALFVVVAAYALAKSAESIYLAATKGKPRG